MFRDAVILHSSTSHFYDVKSQNSKGFEEDFLIEIFISFKRRQLVCIYYFKINNYQYLGLGLAIVTVKTSKLSVCRDRAPQTAISR